MRRLGHAALTLGLCLGLAAACRAEGGGIDARLASRYNGWAGSPAYAQGLVKGLRTGSPITLGKTRIDIPGNRMNYRDVFAALNLARAQLAAAGIGEPTPAQIEAALIGGTVTSSAGTTTLRPILAMRAEGMGWSRISEALGFKRETLLSGKPPAVDAEVPALVSSAAAASK